jgi:hypothetical protein
MRSVPDATPAEESANIPGNNAFLADFCRQATMSVDRPDLRLSRKFQLCHKTHNWG